MKHYYYRRQGSGALHQRHANTNKNSTSVEAIAFMTTVGIILAIVAFNVWVNGIQ